MAAITAFDCKYQLMLLCVTLPAKNLQMIQQCCSFYEAVFTLSVGHVKRFKSFVCILRQKEKKLTAPK
jgi:hypothetical protein